MPDRILRIHTGEALVFGKGEVHYRGIMGTIATITREEGFRSVDYFDK